MELMEGWNAGKHKVVVNLWKEQIAVWIIGLPALLTAVVMEVRHRKRERRREKEE